MRFFLDKVFGPEIMATMGIAIVRLIFLIVAFLAAFDLAGSLPVLAATVTCSWENPQSGILGSYDGIIASNVTSPDPVHGGSRSLKLVDDEASGTPQAYLAWIIGLQDGDRVDASFWVYDTVDGSPGPPSARIWAHYNDDSQNVDSRDGSAGGWSSYSSGNGWCRLDYYWIIDEGHSGLVVEARTYSEPGDTVWIDDLKVTAPGHATIRTPEPRPGDADCNGVVDAADAAVLAANWLTMHGADWSMGDFNGDERVDDADATILACNWPTATVTAPGPSDATMLLPILMAFIARRLRGH